MIRVLLVDDSPSTIAYLKSALKKYANIEVVATASHGREALEQLEAFNPQVVVSDLHMPVMDGFEMLDAILHEHPLPVLIMSSAIESRQDPVTFKILEAGAIDVIPKPKDSDEGTRKRWEKQLVTKIKVLSGVKPFRKKDNSVGIHSNDTFLPFEGMDTVSTKSVNYKILVIGASTGGPQALKKIFSGLPANFSLPVVCVLHINQEFLNEMLQWVKGYTTLKVIRALPGAKPKAGYVYFPPEETHLTIDSDRCFRLEKREENDLFCPAVNKTFNSVAETYGSKSIGVLLTGMGTDGAEGLLAIKNNGGYTIAQSEESCVVFGMPKEAIRLGGAISVLDLEKIINKIVKISEN